MTPATGICRTCQRPAGEVPFNGMTLYGHIAPPHPSHRVRFARTAADASAHASVKEANGGCEDNQRPSEGPTARGAIEDGGPSPDPAPASAGRTPSAGVGRAGSPSTPPRKATRRQPPPVVGRRSPERSSTAASPSLGGLPTVAGRG